MLVQALWNVLGMASNERPSPFQSVTQMLRKKDHRCRSFNSQTDGVFHMTCLIGCQVIVDEEVKALILAVLTAHW